jgi:hypothetical protein
MLPAMAYVYSEENCLVNNSVFLNVTNTFKTTVFRAKFQVLKAVFMKSEDFK